MTNCDRVRAYLQAFASGDVEAVAAHVTEDFINRQHGELGTGCEGAAAYQERLKDFLTTFRSLNYEVEDMFGDGNRVAVAYRMTCDFEGHHIDIPGVMIMTLRDGLIAARSDYWDGLSFLKQTGAYP